MVQGGPSLHQMTTKSTAASLLLLWSVTKENLNFTRNWEQLVMQPTSASVMATSLKAWIYSWSFSFVLSFAGEHLKLDALAYQYIISLLGWGVPSLREAVLTESSWSYGLGQVPFTGQTPRGIVLSLNWSFWPWIGCFETLPWIIIILTGRSGFAGHP